ncbi:nuclear transport factor 2 family protein [Streptomyces sp. NPDC014894]|uniref:nuclear transport factor 2 family protein n=1 Tax=unclassified Streptomyces TaxID=2593676 RepID=UPI0037004C31
MGIATVTDPRSFLEERYNRYNEELLFSDEEAGAIIDRYYTPDFVINSGGIAMGRERLIKHVRPLRKQAVPGGRYEVLEAVQDGNRFASRYIIHAALKHQTMRIEVIEFLEMADDGRISQANSATRNLPDSDG